MSIKKCIRRLFMKVKYKLNLHSRKLIVCTDKDRQIGLSTMIIEDAFYREIKIYVPNSAMRHILTEKLYMKMNHLEKKPGKYSMEYIYNHYFITPDDIRNGIHRGQTAIKILVDNACTHEDIHVLLESESFMIENGFVYVPYGI